MRVLHLFDAACPATCEAKLSLLADLIGAHEGAEGFTHHVAAMHSGSLDERMLTAAGLRHVDRIFLPPGPAWLKRFVMGRYFRRLGGVEVVHLWSPAAAHLLPATVRVVTDDRPDRPGLDPARLVVSERSARRLAWGVTNERTMVVAALGDPPSAVDALRCLWVTGLAAESGMDVRLLVSPRAAGLDRARRVVEALGKPHYLIVDERAQSPWLVLTACDAALSLEGPVDRPPPAPTLTALVHRGSAGGLSLAWALVAAVPIVAERLDGTSPGSAWLGEAAAMCVEPNRPGRAAWVLRQIGDDPALRRRLADAARRRDAGRFDLSDYRRRMTNLYRRISGGEPGFDAVTTDRPPMRAAH